MVRFIYICMAIVIVSFIAVPIFSGVSKEHARLQQVATTDTQTDNTLSFKEIYALADEAQPNPEALNEIEPVAGADTSQDKFSTGFNNTENPALADMPSADKSQETDSAL